MVQCSHGNNAPLKIVERLSECQAGNGRHKCAVCAYEMGKTSALGRHFEGSSEECDQGHAWAPLDMLAALPSSQGGPHRHKCVYEAFQAGKVAGEGLLAASTVKSEERANTTTDNTAETENIAEEGEIVKVINDNSLSETQKEQIVLSRRGQGMFRKNVRLVNDRCWLTGITDSNMLIASHIKPWRVSTNTERLDGYNGFLFAPHVDHLFDKGWISFDPSGELNVSKALDTTVLDCWGISNRKCSPTPTEKHIPYLKYHLKHVFRR